ncbi:MAG TPA: hypothetical protein VGF59_16475 [Bryobacteraceae bacterium]
MIAYSQESGGYYQIYTRRLEEHSQVPAQLTTLRQDSLFPFWHPSGNRIYFLAGGSLWTVGSAGGQPETIIPNVDSAAISPDGHTLVCYRREQKGGALWTATADGQDLRRRLEIRADEESFLRFSPDGRMLAAQLDYRFFLMPFPLPARLDSAAIDFRLPADSFINTFDWMPDSRHFTASVLSSYSAAGLWLGDVRGRTLEPLTSTELLQSNPSVSPDGRRIAYNTYALNWDILEVDLASRTVMPLVASGRYDLSSDEGDYTRAEGHRTRARDLVLRIADSFEPLEPLRRSLLAAPPVRRIFGQCASV